MMEWDGYHSSLAALGSNQECPGPKPGGSANSPSGHCEPIPGIEPDHWPYKGQPAPRPTGVVRSEGLEPSLDSSSSWCLCRWATCAWRRPSESLASRANRGTSRAYERIRTSCIRITSAAFNRMNFAGMSFPAGRGAVPFPERLVARAMSHLRVVVLCACLHVMHPQVESACTHVTRSGYLRGSAPGAGVEPTLLGPEPSGLPLADPGLSGIRARRVCQPGAPTRIRTGIAQLLGLPPLPVGLRGPVHFNEVVREVQRTREDPVQLRMTVLDGQRLAPAVKPGDHASEHCRRPF